MKYLFEDQNLVKTGKDMVWLGPLSMGPDRNISEEYMRTITDRAAYPTVLARTSVMKLYIESVSKHTDEQLKAIADFVRENHLAVAVEIGGMKMCGNDTPDDHMAELAFANEFEVLERFLKQGGRLDYVTTDHAIADMMTVPANPRAHMTKEQLIQQQADYFKLLKEKVPNVKLGMIESLGYFQVRKTDGSGALYERTVPFMRKVDFEEFLTRYLDIMRQNGLEIDHFHIDFGFPDVQYDSMGKAGYDYGRILSVEDYCQKAGIDVGFVAGNAFAEGDGTLEDRQTYAEEKLLPYSKSAEANTIAYFDGYLKDGGHSDYFVFQKWQLYPVQVGPETVSYTTMGIFRSMLGNPLFAANQK